MLRWASYGLPCGRTVALGLMQMFRRPRSTDPQLFTAFLQAQASYVAQKTVLEYCRVKSGRNEDIHFANPDFQAALTHCRWQVYFAALADLSALFESGLRPHAAGREAALAAAMTSVHATALARETPPEAEAATTWELPHRLAAQQQEAPWTADRLPLSAEPVLFATLPIHADQRQGESIAIRGALRFQVVTTQQEWERRFDPAGLAAALLRN